MSPVQKCFTVKHIKNNKKHLQIGVIPDTHSSEPLRLVIHELKKENVDFFIHLGDIVDQAKKEEFLAAKQIRSEEHTSELQSRGHLVCRLLLEKKKQNRHI